MPFFHAQVESAASGIRRKWHPPFPPRGLSFRPGDLSYLNWESSLAQTRTHTDGKNHFKWLTHGGHTGYNFRRTISLVFRKECGKDAPANL